MITILLFILILNIVILVSNRNKIMIEQNPEFSSSYNQKAEYMSKSMKMALEKVEPYLFKYNNMYSIKNKYVSFSYNYYHTVFACINLIDISKNFKINYVSDNDTSVSLSAPKDREYNELFYKVCDIFDEYTTYDDIYSLLQENYNVLSQKPQYKKEEESPIYSDDYYDENDIDIQNAVDINTASLEEIANLPGIGRLTAEKIVVTRGDIGGFTSKEEFYQRYKISTYHQIQLDEMIYFSKRKRPSLSLENENERKIDL